MATISLEEISYYTPNLEEHLRTLVDQIKYDLHVDNIDYVACRVADLMFATNQEFIIEMIKTCPILATASVFVAHRYMQKGTVPWVKESLIPHIHSIEPEITFSDPTEFSSFPPADAAPWTLDKVSAAADAQACFENFEEEQFLELNNPSVVIDGVEYATSY